MKVTVGSPRKTCVRCRGIGELTSTCADLRVLTSECVECGGLGYMGGKEAQQEKDRKLKRAYKQADIQEALLQIVRTQLNDDSVSAI